MDPNSQHQLWSRWTFKVYPSWTKRPNFETARTNCHRFARKAWGTAGQMRVTYEFDKEQRRPYWLVDVRVEGAPAHDPAYREYMLQSWKRFFIEGFGPHTHVDSDTRVEAGDKQDGRPPDQLIILHPEQMRIE